MQEGNIRGSLSILKTYGGMIIGVQQGDCQPLRVCLATKRCYSQNKERRGTVESGHVERIICIDLVISVTNIKRSAETPHSNQHKQ